MRSLPAFLRFFGHQRPFQLLIMRTNRRSFIRTAALSGVGLSVFSGEVLSWTGNRPVRLAYLSHSPTNPLTPAANWSDTLFFTSVNDKAFQQLLQRDDIDALVVDVFPAQRTAIALAAMKAGKPIAFTAPVGQTVSEIQTLSQTYAQTGTPCLLLDNDRFERNTLAICNMVAQHQFGNLTHVACGTDSPTNGLGPAAEWLGINRGNRFVSLNASVSQSWGLHEPTPTGPEPKNGPIVKQYQLGEVLTINLRCANGQTLTVSRDLSGKRPHSRGYRVQGTNGLWMENNDLFTREGRTDSFADVRPPFDHPYWHPNRPKNQPEPNALSELLTALKTRTIDPDSTRNALTISLVYAVANLSLVARNDELDVPDWLGNNSVTA